MAFLLAQGGASLYKIDLTTGVATTLTLPTGVTLDTTRKPKFAILNQWVVMTNSPTRNLAIDPEGTVRVMVPAAPTAPPTLAAGSGSGLTGTYQGRDSFIVTNSDGELLMESPLGPISQAVTVANKDLAWTDVAVSTDVVSARRTYRNTDAGSTYYHLLDHDGNTSTAFLNNTPDASLSLLPALSATLISPPGTVPGIRFKNIIEWKSRLWAIPDLPDLLDTVFVSETNKIYAWPNQVVAHPTGQDSQGLIGFVPRRNQLGLLKRNGLWQIGGVTAATGVAFSNISVTQIASDRAGGVSPEATVVVNDKAYWLGVDGVYEWTDEGVASITDMTVAPWFKSDTYFNRTRFGNAFAKLNVKMNQVEFHLAAAGSSVEDRWVAFNLTNRQWYGPHKTGKFTPSHAGGIHDANVLPVMLVGGTDGVVYVGNSTSYHDGTVTPIDWDCYGPFLSADEPDIHHFWGEMSILTRVEAAGTLTVTPTVGRLDSNAQSGISVDLTKGRQLLRRLGDGPLVRLRFQQATVDQGVSLYGYEVPFFEDGRR